MLKNLPAAAKTIYHRRDDAQFTAFYNFPWVMMTDNPFDAFLSHHGADKPAVEGIAAALHRQGLNCFLDKWDIAPGDEWLRNLEQGLRDSRFIVIFFGPDGIGPYQQAEADAALRRQIQ